MKKETRGGTETDAVRDWLRKDIMTWALMTSGQLEPVLTFDGSFAKGDAVKVLVELTLYADDGGHEIKFTVHPEPTSLPKTLLRGTTPAEETEGRYWRIGKGRRKKDDYKWQLIVPAIDEFCTLRDAVLYLQTVYGYNEDVSDQDL